MFDLERRIPATKRSSYKANKTRLQVRRRRVGSIRERLDWGVRRDPLDVTHLYFSRMPESHNRTDRGREEDTQKCEDSCEPLAPPAIH